jgi:inward rectifier potassium channel
MPSRIRYVQRPPAKTRRGRRRGVKTPNVGAPRLTLVREGLPSEILVDTYHYLIRASWPALFGLILAVFIVTNCLFALGYLFDGGIENARHGSFGDAFFFSVQTMATIGYGKMAPVTTAANILVSFEALFGLMALALVTGLVFAKFSRPSSGVRFSRYAVLSDYDGVPSLMFRMANSRADEIVDAQVQVALTRREVTGEGQMMIKVRDLGLIRYRNPMFGLTWTAIHPITEASPLYAMTADDLKPNSMWVVISLTGLDGALSQTVHARHVYGAADIQWGARLVDLFRQEADGSWHVDLDSFDHIETAPPPRKAD